MIALALALFQEPVDPATIDRVRREVRETPTDESTAEERGLVLLAWARQLLREGAPVPEALPRERADEIRRLIERRRFAEAAPLLDEGFAALERIAAAGAESREIPLTNPATGARLWAAVWLPEGASEDHRVPALVMIPGGLGFGSEMRGELTPSALARFGIAVAVFDPDGRGRSAGDEDWNGARHQEGLRALLVAVRELPFVDRENVGILSMSLGLALAAGALGRWPDDPPVRYFIDWEGPCDRFYITKNDDPRFLRIFGSRTTDEEEWWAEREAVRWAPSFRCRYLRLQSERDHVHGPDFGHALAMIRAATGHAPWTRINGPENEANRAYTEEDPPRLLPAGRRLGAADMWRYIREMAQFPETPETPRKHVRVPTTAAEVRVVSALPTGESGAEIGETPAFDERVVATAGGVVEIDVGAEPVYVIEGPLPEERRPPDGQPFGFHPASVGDSDYRAAREIGLSWDRGGLYAMWVFGQPDPAEPRYVWDQYDPYFRRLPPDMRALKNITVAMAPMIEGRTPPGARRVDVSRHVGTGSYVPLDPDAYAAWVRAFVERYDGDGVDDMPGLATPARTWQIDNEPPHRLRGYAELCRLTYRAIKEADPDARVLIGGVAWFPNVGPNPRLYEEQYLPILRELGGEGFDVFDTHWFGFAGEWKTCAETLARLRRDLAECGFADVPVWICEMGTSSDARQTERAQAAELVRRHVVALGEGVERIFWAWGMIEGFGNPRDNDFFDHTGLIYDGIGEGDPGRGVRKVAYWTYGKMTDLLGRCDTRRVERLAVEGAVAYRFPFAGEHDRGVIVVWSDE